MELSSSIMYRKGDIVYLSRCEVIRAFLKTEEDENEEMAQELNVLLNIFCAAEREGVRSIPFLPFDAADYRRVISYISTL